MVFDSSIIPENWLIGIKKPIYKNKGDKFNPDNFRAITLISSLGKLFTSILNDRLNDFSCEFDLISKNQAGFRKGHSTTDNIFVLHSLISLYLSSGKKYTVYLLTLERHSTLSGGRDYGRNSRVVILRENVSKLSTICIIT